MIYSRWIIIILFTTLFPGDKQPKNFYTIMSETKKWIVTVSDPRSLAEISRDLTKNGFKVDQVMDEIGCITGSASGDVVKKARTIPGVSDISPEEGIDIGPPGSETTW